MLPTFEPFHIHVKESGILVHTPFAMRKYGTKIHYHYMLLSLIATFNLSATNITHENYSN